MHRYRDFLTSLYFIRTKDLDVSITAEMKNDELEFVEVDSRNTLWLKGKSYRYNYIYRLDDINTSKLLTLIGGTNLPKESLENTFSGIDGCLKLVAFCKEYDITLEKSYR